MSLWPRSLGWRLAIAVVCSVTAIGVLAIVVERIDTQPKPTKGARSLVARMAAADDDADASEADVAAARSAASIAAKPGSSPRIDSTLQLSKSSPSAPATLARALGFRLQPTPGTIMLVQREGSLAPDIAPVVEILASGEVVLRRPMAVAAGPGQVAPLSGQGHGAGVILPERNLDLLSPAARAALIGLLQLWVRERPVLPAKLASNDMQLVPETVRRLLSWVP